MTSRAQRHKEKEGPRKPTITEILQTARKAFAKVEQALADLLGDDPERRLPGFHNIAVWGQSFTTVLHKLRGTVGKDAYEAWYAPYREEMKGDDLMRYFWERRSEILKEGKTPLVQVRMRMDGKWEGSIMSPIENSPRPPGKIYAQFIGDETGGSGWIVQREDGTLEKHYVPLPDDFPITETTLHVVDPPKTHKGQSLDDASIEALSTLYVEYLREMLDDACATFAESPGKQPNPLNLV